MPLEYHGVELNMMMYSSYSSAADTFIRNFLLPSSASFFHLPFRSAGAESNDSSRNDQRTGNPRLPRNTHGRRYIGIDGPRPHADIRNDRRLRIVQKRRLWGQYGGTMGVKYSNICYI